MKIGVEDMLEYHGVTSALYLRFQELGIHCLTVLTLISLLVTLPINLSGTTAANEQDRPYQEVHSLAMTHDIYHFLTI